VSISHVWYAEYMRSYPVSGDVLHPLRERLATALRDELRGLGSELQEVASYHLGYTDAEGHPFDGGGGKLLRPCLTLLCAQAAGGQVGSAMPAAVAVQLVHEFSLLHDDIMDNDPTRRGRDTAWRVFGATRAILAGDGLLSLAMQVLSRVDGQCGNAAMRQLTDAVLTLTRGQATDLALEAAPTVTEDQARQVAWDKTAVLFGAACLTGATIVGVPPGGLRANGFHRFGLALGLAFQLVDDLLGVWGDPQVTGKPVGADLARRKKSLPVAHALAAERPASVELARRYATPPCDDPVQVKGLAELVDQAGGRRWATGEAHRQVHAAIHAVCGLDGQDDHIRGLHSVARGVLDAIPEAE
jgi:geranylgeranyl diphosphate synthase, type I